MANGDPSAGVESGQVYALSCIEVNFPSDGMSGIAEDRGFRGSI